MARYIWRDDNFVDREGVAMLLPKRKKLCTPLIIADIPDYRSPIDGRLISTRSQRRDDLKRNGCVEYEPSMSPTKGKEPKFRNTRFAKKHNLKLGEEYRTT